MYEDYFAKQLRQYRESQGWTLQEMADVLHTSKQVLSRYETGQRTPKISVANEFASILQIPLSYFMPDPPHWEDDIYEDWRNSRSDDERKLIVQRNGLDPRVYSDYLSMVAESSPVVPPFRVSDHERELIIEYRKLSQAEKKRVDMMLGLEPEPVPQPKNA